MVSLNSVKKSFGDCQSYLNSLTEYLQANQKMFLLLWLQFNIVQLVAQYRMC